jgi:predicted ATPase
MNQAQIENFRGIGNLTLPLSTTLTALMGPGGCGKSRVLHGIEASASTSGRISPVYDFDPFQMSRAAPLESPMLANGFGMPAAIRRRSEREPPAKASWVESAARHVSRHLEREQWSIDGQKHISLNTFLRSMADSSLFTLGIFAAVYSASPGDLLLFENIDRGLYFRDLGKLVKELELACSRIPGLQIVFSTHSADLLDHLQPDQIRILSALEDGDVTCMSLPDHPDFKTWAGVCTPGEILSIILPK